MSNTNQPSVGFVITNPLTGRPMEKFVGEHWENPVFCAEIKE
jgi:hypothetical protein